MRKGEKIVGFGQKLRGVTAAREFDIVFEKKLIECKNRNFELLLKNQDTYTEFKRQIKEQFKIAQELNKNFELHSKSPIPNEIKEWLNKQKITFFEG